MRGSGTEPTACFTISAHQPSPAQGGQFTDLRKKQLPAAAAVPPPTLAQRKTSQTPPLRFGSGPLTRSLIRAASLVPAASAAAGSRGGRGGRSDGSRLSRGVVAGEGGSAVDAAAAVDGVPSPLLHAQCAHTKVGGWVGGLPCWKSSLSRRAELATAHRNSKNVRAMAS